MRKGDICLEEFALSQYHVFTKKKHTTFLERIKVSKLKLEKLKDKVDLRLAAAVFVVYIWCLVWVIGLKYNSPWIYELREYMLKLPLSSRVGNNWIPFYSLVKSVENGTYAFNLDHFLNVVIYIPMGIYLFVFLDEKVRYRWSAVISLSVIAVSSLIFEIVQLFTGLGGCDGTDFVCNFFGGAVGFLLISVLRLLMKKHYVLSLNLVNVLCLIGFVPAGIYFLVNTIVNAGQYAPIL